MCGRSQVRSHTNCTTWNRTTLARWRLCVSSTFFLFAPESSVLFDKPSHTLHSSRTPSQTRHKTKQHQPLNHNPLPSSPVPIQPSTNLDNHYSTKWTALICQAVRQCPWPTQLAATRQQHLQVELHSSPRAPTSEGGPLERAVTLAITTTMMKLLTAHHAVAQSAIGLVFTPTSLAASSSRPRWSSRTP